MASCRSDHDRSILSDDGPYSPPNNLVDTPHQTLQYEPAGGNVLPD